MTESGSPGRVEKCPVSRLTPTDDRLSGLIHALGALLAAVGTTAMLFHPPPLAGPRHLAGAAVFGATMILLYVASACYHYTRDLERKKKLQVVDHIAIYFLIAGTYTPVTLVPLYGWHGWSILGAVWTMTGLGTAFKLFSTGRFVLTSTIFYVLMGWFITIAIIPLSRALPLEGMIWLIAGGACYTLGALIYLWDERLPFSHPLFHLFVLAGSACHFLLVYQVVLFMA